MRTELTILALLGLVGSAAGSVVVNQVPVSGGGLARASQLWQDPSGQGNDLDGDSVCWADFTLSAETTITHLEWWGAGACELGFQIEFWKQDPGTIAYQPWAFFYYGGGQTVTACQDKAGTDESSRRAAEWIRENLGVGVDPPAISEGSTVLHF